MGNFIEHHKSKSFIIKIGRKELEFPENSNTSQKLQIFLDKITTETQGITNELKILRKEIVDGNSKKEGDNVNKKFIGKENEEEAREEIKLTEDDKKNMEEFLNDFNTENYDDFFKNFKMQMEQINNTRHYLIEIMEEKYKTEYNSN